MIPSSLEDSIRSFQEQEVDFHDGLTLLSRLILDQKFLAACNRLRRQPEEAFTWTTAKVRRSRPVKMATQLRRQDSWPVQRASKRRRNIPNEDDSTEYAMRQLPLHIACQFLGSQTKTVEKLEQLIRILVTTNPRACGQYDHNGRLPLHEAIAWNASSSIISTLFMGCPEAIYQCDSSGMLPLELLQVAGRQDANELSQQLHQGYDLWCQSRNEYMIRFSMGARSLDTKTEGSSEAVAQYLSGRVAYASSLKGIETSHSLVPSEMVERLETSMEDLRERNQELVVAVNTLTVEKERLQQILDTNSSVKKMYELEDENIDLRRKLHRRELFLHDKGLDASGSNFMDVSEERNVSMMSMDPEPATVLTRYLETKVAELTEESEQLEDLNEDLEIQNDTLKQLLVELRRKEASDTRERNLHAENESVPTVKETVPDNDSYLKQRVTELEMQLIEARAEKAALLSDMKKEPKTGSGLESQLKEIDRRSSHVSLEDQLRELDRRSSHAGVATPQSNKNTAQRAKDKDEGGHKADNASSRVSSNDKIDGGDDTARELTLKSSTSDFDGHGSFQTGVDSQATGRVSTTSKMSSTSWGMLSMVQNTPKTKKKWSNALEPLPQGSESKDDPSALHDSFDHSLASFEQDIDFNQLESLYQASVDAAEGNEETDTKPNRHEAAAVFNPTTLRRFERKQSQRNLGAATSRGGLQKKRSKRKVTSESLVDAARLLAAEEEISAIVKETEELLGRDLDTDLVRALKESSVTMIKDIKPAPGESNDALRSLQTIAEALMDDRLVDETEEIYGRIIPADIVSSLKAASTTRIETSRQEIEAMEVMKRRLEVELLDTLIETAERQLHRALPFDVAMALRDTAAKFPSLLCEDVDGNGLLVSLYIDFKQMDSMFDQSQKALGRAFSEDLTVALRRAVFVLQSRLEGVDFSGAQESYASALDSSAKSSLSTTPEAKMHVSVSSSAAQNSVSNRSDANAKSNLGLLSQSQRSSTVVQDGETADQRDMYDKVSTRAGNSSQDFNGDIVGDTDEDSINDVEVRNTVSDLHALFPPKRRHSDDAGESSSSTSESESEAESIDSSHVPLSTTVNSTRGTDLNPMVTEEDPGSGNLLQTAKDLLGDNVTPEILEALKLLSLAAAKQNDQNTEDEDEDNSTSGDVSRHSEMSLNLSAVFNPHRTSNLEKKLKKLEHPPTPSATSRFSTQRLPATPRGAKPPTRSKSPTRGVRKSKSGDDQLFPGIADKTRGVRRTKSAELVASSRSFVPPSPGTAYSRTFVPQSPATTHSRTFIPPSPAKSLNSFGDSFALVTGGGQDDLEKLYKDAVKQSEGDTSLLASTHHMPNQKGEAAFETIISDTEETYGIGIPPKVVEALKAATVASAEAPFLSIVRSLHDNEIISNAQSRAGVVIPEDLLAAIRSTSLPPGVSVESLRPLDGSTSIDMTKKYNTSQGSMALSLALTESSSKPGESENLLDLSGFGDSNSTEIEVDIQNTSHGDVDGSEGRKDTQLLETGHLSAEDLLASLPGEIESNTNSDNASVRSNNSWGVLSLSKSPSAKKKKKSRRATKKHRKGTKDAMFERAQRRKNKPGAFMNSLADIAAPSDDLRDLYKQAKQSLDTDEVQKRRKSRPKKLPLPHNQEDSMEGHQTILNMASIPKPSGASSCIILSPQEAELDMLFIRFEEVAGRSIPIDIELALRKASKIMDDSSDVVAPYKEHLKTLKFGSH